MNKIKTKNNIRFIDFFVSKEEQFLIRLNAEAFKNKDFKFYIEWFVYAIYDHMQEEYDIEKQFTFFFTNNFNLNIIFFIYIMNDEFRQRVKNDIIEYKNKFRKEHIYD